jgi:archaeosine-15-forming tRNA-guanine transglycosylase
MGLAPARPGKRDLDGKPPNGGPEPGKSRARPSNVGNTAIASSQACGQKQRVNNSKGARSLRVETEQNTRVLTPNNTKFLTKRVHSPCIRVYINEDRT